MAAVDAYNTEAAQFTSQEKAIYHLDDACPFGRKIKTADKVAGQGSDPVKDGCPLCVRPAVS